MRFRDHLKVAQYDRLVAAFQRKDKMLFTPDGKPYSGSSFAANFWAGYNGVDGGLYRPNDPQYRKSPGYVFYAAGQHCRKIK